MIRRQVGEQFDRLFGDLQAHAVEHLIQPRCLQHRREIGIGRQRLVGQRRAGRRAEQQVLADGCFPDCRRPVRTRRPVRSNPSSSSRLRSAARSSTMRSDQLLMTQRIGRCAQAKIENIARQHHCVEHMAYDAEKIVRAGRAGGCIVDPVAVQIKVGIAGPARFVDVPTALFGLFRLRKSPSVSGACFSP